jgi:hypothetical protein
MPQSTGQYPQVNKAKMNINRAGKQQKACWKNERRLEAKWSDVQKMLQGHAAGWLAGVAWAKRNIKSKRALRNVQL